MTQDEKHALIAEKLEGWVWVRFGGDPEQTSSGKILAFLASPADWGSWLKPPEYIKDDGKYKREFKSNIPDYSSDLNLCARAEAKMPKRQYGEYPKFVHQAVGIAAPFEHGQSSWELFLMLSASAPTRVEAMVALIGAWGL